MPSKKERREEFMALARSLPVPPSSVLASAEPPPSASPDVRHAAAVLVGGVDRDPERVARVERDLEKLVELKRATAAKQRNAGG
jgi:hypothetical protein